MSRLKLKRSLTSKKTKKNSELIVLKKHDIPYVKNLFCQYQIDWINDRSPFAVFAKGRRIGVSFASAFSAVLEAIKGYDVTYTTYNFSATKKFISNCGKFAKALNFYFEKTYNIKVINDKDILTYSIHFPNGASIQAVSSNAENLRDRTGWIYLDEYAFREQQSELLKAANAVMVRGGYVRVISTHNGENNDFNKLCKQVILGEQPGSYHFCSFDMAIEQGMFRSMMLSKGKSYSKELEASWRKEVRKLYQGFEKEELDGIPSRMTGNQIFDPSWFLYINLSDRDILSNSCSIVYFDLASTDLEKATKNSYFTAYVQLVCYENYIVVYDFDAVLLSGADNNEWRKTMIKSFKYSPMVYLESEPGSNLFMDYARQEVEQYCGVTIQEYKPVKSKILRALPLVPYLKNRDDTEFSIVLHERLRTKMFTDPITQESKNFVGWVSLFDGTSKPIITDLTDCLSGSFDILYREMLSSF